jgi:uncharacterized protein YbjQ (UPF0145 family)
MEFLVFLGLMVLGYVVGTQQEQAHFRQLQRREHQLRNLSVVNFGAKESLPTTRESAMFVGSVVISSDYFKTVIASLINLVGGRMGVYETLLERGRREALLRMKEEAVQWGATQVLNVRMETSSISGDAGRRGLVAIEIIAYGTGVKEKGRR